MPWVILAAALCALVWFWPRNTLIGLAVVGTAGALVGIAFWGYGVYAERQRELVAITVEPAAEAASRVPPGIACGEGELLVSITNGSGKTVLSVRFRQPDTGKAYTATRICSTSTIWNFRQTGLPWRQRLRRSRRTTSFRLPAR